MMVDKSDLFKNLPKIFLELGSIKPETIFENFDFENSLGPKPDCYYPSDTFNKRHANENCKVCQAYQENLLVLLHKLTLDEFLCK